MYLELASTELASVRNSKSPFGYSIFETFVGGECKLSSESEREIARTETVPTQTVGVYGGFSSSNTPLDSEFSSASSSQSHSSSSSSVDSISTLSDSGKEGIQPAPT